MQDARANDRVRCTRSLTVLLFGIHQRVCSFLLKDTARTDMSSAAGLLLLDS